MTDLPLQSRTNWRQAIGWGAYLGMSWTWCIGMFLPVLLVRDYGIWGWIVFAIPNVLGAAAMGWVLFSDDSSRWIEREHPGACAAFSIVTIAFHAFFLSWMVQRLLGPATYVYVALAVVCVLLGTKSATARSTALVLFLLSIAVFFALKQQAPARPHVPAELSRRDLLFLAPVCVFGFALCPYLDLTFIRARNENTRLGAKIAFTTGFCVFFFAMILFTLWYAPFLTRWVFAGARMPRDTFTRLLGIYLMLQASFTIGLHLERLLQNRRDTRLIAINLAILLSLTVTAIGFWLNRAEQNRQLIYHGVEWGEVIYRVFMGFYGLIFPTYVWLAIIPGRKKRFPSRSRVILAVSILLALPFFWTGFIENRMIALVPGLALVLLARLLISNERPISGEVTHSAQARQLL